MATKSRKKDHGKSALARDVFRQVYNVVRLNQSVFIHPKTERIESSRWETVAWNTAWIAADAVDEGLKDIR